MSVAMLASYYGVVAVERVAFPSRRQNTFRVRIRAWRRPNEDGVKRWRAP